MKLKNILILLFVLSVFSGFSQEKSLDLYLLIGQSNMAGRGKIEAQDTTVHPQVFTFNKYNKWVLAKDPIHFDKSVAGVGLGRTFGIEMANTNPNIQIGLIPCAVGGSPIDSWKPGGFHEQTNTYPWDEMEKRLKEAMKSGKVKGILWHQGESDSNPEKCAAYKIKLEELITRLRNFLSDDEIPFVAGEFGRFKIKNNKQQYPELKLFPAKVVMMSTKEVVKKDINAAFVKTKGLNHKGDNTHFDAKSYRILGKRYAKAMQKLQKK